MSRLRNSQVKERTRMNDRVELTPAIKDSIEHLRRVMARDIKVGNSLPGESQQQNIQAVIAELERAIE
jgi:hypothetical protein